MIPEIIQKNLTVRLMKIIHPRTSSINSCVQKVLPLQTAADGVKTIHHPSKRFGSKALPLLLHSSVIDVWSFLSSAAAIAVAAARGGGGHVFLPVEKNGKGQDESTNSAKVVEEVFCPSATRASSIFSLRENQPQRPKNTCPSSLPDLPTLCCTCVHYACESQHRSPSHSHTPPTGLPKTDDAATERSSKTTRVRGGAGRVCSRAPVAPHITTMFYRIAASPPIQQKASNNEQMLAWLRRPRCTTTIDFTRPRYLL
ncbi:unnamed protein product [Ectocarpus sp. 12 AP-2014]